MAETGEKRVLPRIDEVLEAINGEEYAGFCIGCGSQAFGVEPDAHEYECECCGHALVYGAEEILLQQLYRPAEKKQKRA